MNHVFAACSLSGVPHAVAQHRAAHRGSLHPLARLRGAGGGRGLAARPRRGERSLRAWLSALCVVRAGVGQSPAAALLFLPRPHSVLTQGDACRCMCDRTSSSRFSVSSELTCILGRCSCTSRRCSWPRRGTVPIAPRCVACCLLLAGCSVPPSCMPWSQFQCILASAACPDDVVWSWCAHTGAAGVWSAPPGRRSHWGTPFCLWNLAKYQRLVAFAATLVDATNADGHGCAVCAQTRVAIEMANETFKVCISPEIDVCSECRSHSSCLCALQDAYRIDDKELLAFSERTRRNVVQASNALLLLCRLVSLARLQYSCYCAIGLTAHVRVCPDNRQSLSAVCRRDGPASWAPVRRLLRGAIHSQRGFLT